MSPEASKTYYATTGQGPVIPRSPDAYADLTSQYTTAKPVSPVTSQATSSVSPTTDAYADLKPAYEVGDNTFNPAEFSAPTPETIGEQSEQVVPIPNSKAGYKYENIYARKTPEGAKDYAEDMRRGQVRRMVGKWIKGKDDDFIDIQELSGDAKVNKPDKQEKTLLREYFKRPLQRLTINNK